MNRLAWIALGLFALSAPAAAQSVGSPQVATQPGTSGSPGDSAAALKTLDTDGDGRISEREAQQNPELSSQFAALDRDDDSQLDTAEFARFEIGGETQRTNERSRGGLAGETDSDARNGGGRDTTGERSRDADQGRSR